jgi:hypothetical protein
MKKWADYLISAVRYSEQQNKKMISYFKVHQDKENAIGAGFTWSRDEVISAVNEGKTFYTIRKKNNGDWEKGNTVSVIEANNGMVITDSNFSFQDQLSHLLEL